jgi:hypothetical protein
VPTSNDVPIEWLPLVGRSMGLLCLHAEELRGAPLVDQWLLLERLGFPRDEAARILGTTAETLRVSTAQRKSRAKKVSIN